MESCLQYTVVHQRVLAERLILRAFEFASLKLLVNIEMVVLPCTWVLCGLAVVTMAKVPQWCMHIGNTCYG